MSSNDMSSADLDNWLLEFPIKGQKSAFWTARMAVQGLQVWGSTGSGKSSGSGKSFAIKYLSAGFGGLVLTAKPTELDLWKSYCHETGRTKDLIVIEPGSEHVFNFLEYVSQSGANQERTPTDNIADVLKTVIKAGDSKGSNHNDDFWESAMDLLLGNVIDLCQLAYGKVTIQRLYDIVVSLPKASITPNSASGDKSAFDKAMARANHTVGVQIRAWEETHSKDMKERCLDKDFFNEEAANVIPDARLLTYVERFFNVTYKTMAEKTRSIIDFSFCAFLYSLLRDPVYTLFCKNPSTVTPEDCLKGKIIIVNLPVKIFQKVGQDCQIMFKYIWQKAMEKRNVSENSRPLFLWADEAQLFLHQHDTAYQATARSSRIATVYITQNISNYMACMGSGESSKHLVEAFLGTMGTQIFHANSNVATNQYASSLIGQALFEEESKGMQFGNDFSQSNNRSWKFYPAVRPEEFVSLKTGGPNNNRKVTGIVYCQGDPLFNGRNYHKATFLQNNNSSF